jgi:hypothetical protein
MKKKLLFYLVFLFFFLFLARGGWLPNDLRLDTGDSPGANDSLNPQISSSDSNVYIVWADKRNGNSDLYFNYSTDNGATFQPSDIRLDTGDLPGAHSSLWPQIASAGSNVYVVWFDERHGSYDYDIYFNYSLNGGATWQASDIRLNKGVPPGTGYLVNPQISCSGNNVYVVWNDGLNDEIYFNSSADGGETWQATEIQLDTGFPQGISYRPHISSCGSNVYVVWGDERNGGRDIYFNYSADGGITWQPTDIRLDLGDPPGANWSFQPDVSCVGNNVYVVWGDMRNGGEDIYFNYSTNAGATWQASDIRLDTGDLPGAHQSWSYRINSSGSYVYSVWNDNRNGKFDIYFNYSADSGVTWQTSDIRLDTGDSPGANHSAYAEIGANGDNVYVVWCDERNGNPDVYFNHSFDGGATWQSTDTRIDTGDVAGLHESWNPQVSINENNVFVVWYDDRNGGLDIYFNTASSPVPDIKANGSDGPVTINRSDTLSITVEFNSGFMSGHEADWWLAAQTPLGWYYFHRTSGWLPGREVTLQIPLRDLPLREVLNMSGLPAGSYSFYFGIDLVKNGNINMGQAYYDSVEVTINP